MNKSWGIVALVVAALYWLQAVLIPMALAVLLTFLLSPVVGILQRRRLGRVPAVLVTVLLAFSILGGIGWTGSPYLHECDPDERALGFGIEGLPHLGDSEQRTLR